MIIAKTPSRSPAAVAVKLLLLIALGVLILSLAAVLLLKKDTASDLQPLASRPAPNKLLFDFAGIFRLQNEVVENYLASIRDRYQIAA
jgi:hypothetical protein